MRGIVRDKRIKKGEKVTEGRVIQRERRTAKLRISAGHDPDRYMINTQNAIYS